MWVHGTDDNTLKEEFCKSGYYCEIDWDADTTLNNLLIQLGFECASGVEIGLIGFTFLFGVLIGCATVTKLGDKYGRKPIYMLGMFLHISLVSILFFYEASFFEHGLLMMLGVSLTARYYVGYTFSVEL